MTTEIIIAGFGGQGIQSMGKIIASAGMLMDKKVSWLPSYGPEMRGGTSNCHVIVSDELIGSPILNDCDALIVMNGPSLDKFEKYVRQGGVIIIDSTMINNDVKRNDVKVFKIPATQMALEYGNPTYAGVILLGKLLKETNVVTERGFEEGLKYSLPAKKHGLIPEEMDALMKGSSYGL